MTSATTICHQGIYYRDRTNPEDKPAQGEDREDRLPGDKDNVHSPVILTPQTPCHATCPSLHLQNLLVTVKWKMSLLFWLTRGRGNLPTSSAGGKAEACWPARFLYPCTSSPSLAGIYMPWHQFLEDAVCVNACVCTCKCARV